MSDKITSFNNPEKSSRTWIISFIDLLSVLIAFFILIYALAPNQIILDNETQTPIEKFLPNHKVNTLLYLQDILEQKAKDNELLKDIVFYAHENQLIMSINLSNLYKLQNDVIVFTQAGQEKILFIYDILVNNNNAVSINAVNLHSVSNDSSDVYLPLKVATEFVKQLEEQGVTKDLTISFVNGYNKSTDDFQPNFIRRLDVIIHDYAE